MGTFFVFDESNTNAIMQWLSAINSEISYWNNWFETKGLFLPEDYSERTAGEIKFAYPEILAGQTIAKVLDVGAGPISGLGNIINGNSTAIQLSACDPLAFVYKEMLNRANIKPYVVSEFALTERLCDVYPQNSFDIVNMTNALDHAFNPLLGVYNMLAVCKIGGSVTLRHRENEAEFEDYVGLHNWNICEDSGNLIFWNKSEYINVTDTLGENAKVIVSRIGDGTQKLDTYIFVQIIKLGECEFTAIGTNIYNKIFAQVAFYFMSAKYREIAVNEGVIKKLKKALAELRKSRYPFGKKIKAYVLFPWYFYRGINEGIIDKLKKTLAEQQETPCSFGERIQVYALFPWHLYTSIKEQDY